MPRITELWNAIKALPRMEKQMGAVANALAGVSEQLAKVKTEILGKIADLETQLANAGKLDDADLAAIQAVKDSVDDVDRVVPDAPTPEPGETGLESRLPGEPTA